MQHAIVTPDGRPPQGSDNLKKEDNPKPDGREEQRASLATFHHLESLEHVVTRLSSAGYDLHMTVEWPEIQCQSQEEETHSGRNKWAWTNFKAQHPSVCANPLPEENYGADDGKTANADDTAETPLAKQPFNGASLLHLAAMHDANIGVVRALCKLGLDVDTVDAEQKTPSFYAVAHASPSILRYLLLECNAACDVRDGGTGDVRATATAATESGTGG